MFFLDLPKGHSKQEDGQESWESRRFDYSFECIFHLTSHYDTSQAIVQKSEQAISGSNSGHLRGKRDPPNGHGVGVDQADQTFF